MDTNVPLCSRNTDPADAAKRDKAVALLDKDDGALSVQVLQEFYVQATRPTRPDRLSHQHAVDEPRPERTSAVERITAYHQLNRPSLTLT